MVTKDNQIKLKSSSYFGKAKFSRTSPPVSYDDLPALNIEISFEEALKLYVSLQACIQSLNKYHRGTKLGKAMGLHLWVNVDNKSLHVSEGKITE